MGSNAVFDAGHRETPGDRARRQPGPPDPPGAPDPTHSPYSSKYLAPTVTGSAKILVVGPFGVGKTTLIGTVSEIKPLSTEEELTEAGAAVDGAALPAGAVGDASGGTSDCGSKSTTTVGLDFGRITINGVLALYLFGTPGQQRFLPTWRDLAKGSLGALALVDARDPESSFEALDNLEDLGLPFAVAVNRFPGSPHYPDAELREALDLLPGTPLVSCDARDPRSSVRALIALLRHLIDDRQAAEAAAGPTADDPAADDPTADDPAAGGPVAGGPVAGGPA
ncbi:GTP-binding protein [Streptomyces sp. NPDC020412]|uniref:GTP-binding protein n=1 Tax=Streptomyces sp. NPDC020412 TaxID=3365073 RepID=UPI0037BD7607